MMENFTTARSSWQHLNPPSHPKISKRETIWQWCNRKYRATTTEVVLQEIKLDFAYVSKYTYHITENAEDTWACWTTLQDAAGQYVGKSLGQMTQFDKQDSNKKRGGEQLQIKREETCQPNVMGGPSLILIQITVKRHL